MLESRTTSITGLTFGHPHPRVANIDFPLPTALSLLFLSSPCLPCSKAEVSCRLNSALTHTGKSGNWQIAG